MFYRLGSVHIHLFPTNQIESLRQRLERDSHTIPCPAIQSSVILYAIAIDSIGQRRVAFASDFDIVGRVPAAAAKGLLRPRHATTITAMPLAEGTPAATTSTADNRRCAR